MPAPATDSDHTLTLKAALDSQREALAAMKDTDVLPTPGLDVSNAVGIATGSIPRIQQMRAAVVEVLGEDEAAPIDALPVAAAAAEQAIIEHAAAESSNDLSSMRAELAEEHQLLLGDAEALANRKRLDRARLDAGRPVQGYRALIQSTLVLVALLRELWEAIEPHTMLTSEDLDRAEAKAQRMLKRMHERDQGTTQLDASDLRARAMTQFIRTYEEVRRRITYVRWWEGDVDEIAPSLWSGRRGRTAEARPTSPATPETPITPETPATPVTPVAPVTDGSERPRSPNNGGGPFTS